MAGNAQDPEFNPRARNTDLRSNPGGTGKLARRLEGPDVVRVTQLRKVTALLATNDLLPKPEALHTYQPIPLKFPKPLGREVGGQGAALLP